MRWIRFQKAGLCHWGFISGDHAIVVSLTWEEILNGVAPRVEAEIPLDQIQLRAPLGTPGKVLAIGQNYLDHCREQKMEPPDRPLIFSVLPSSIIGPGDTIEWSSQITSQVDLEAELAVVIGKQTRQVTESEAPGSVFGYTVANDVTARDLQASDGQWTRAKGMDTFCPLGPLLVTADEIESPQKLRIASELNGQAMQSSTTAEMIFSVAELISYVSQGITLNPGDVLLTGTPDGVGKFRTPPIFLSDGDLVAVEIEGIGRMENPCRVRQ